MSRGGHRPNSGRKSKADELHLSAYAKDAIRAKFGSEQEFWEHIAGKSKESIQHLKLLVEYAFGKPEQSPPSKTKFIVDVKKDSLPAPQIVVKGGCENCR